MAAQLQTYAQRLQDKIVHSNFVVYNPVVYKRDVTCIADKETNREKHSTFLAILAVGEI